MTILIVGIDLAKNVFAVHGVNQVGRAELVRPAVPRDQLQELVAGLTPVRFSRLGRPRAPRPTFDFQRHQTGQIPWALGRPFAVR